jgi:hypothetical protein
VEIEGSNPAPSFAHLLDVRFGALFVRATQWRLKLPDELTARLQSLVDTPDTRTGVYALGVVLYKLLADSPPIDAKQLQRGAFLEMLRMVRECDPPKPSTKVSRAEALPNIAASRAIEPEQLKRASHGDLDWIVMKSLEKDRARRYETANGFAADVLRHLSCEPVQAAPPSRACRLRKLVRTRRGMVVAASLVVLALFAGIAGTTLGAVSGGPAAGGGGEDAGRRGRARQGRSTRSSRPTRSHTDRL